MPIPNHGAKYGVGLFYSLSKGGGGLGTLAGETRNQYTYHPAPAPVPCLLEVATIDSRKTFRVRLTFWEVIFILLNHLVYPSGIKNRLSVGFLLNSVEFTLGAVEIM